MTGTADIKAETTTSADFNKGLKATNIPCKQRTGSWGKQYCAHEHLNHQHVWPPKTKHATTTTSTTQRVDIKLRSTIRNTTNADSSNLSKCISSCMGTDKPRHWRQREHKSRESNPEFDLISSFHTFHCFFDLLPFWLHFNRWSRRRQLHNWDRNNCNLKQYTKHVSDEGRTNFKFFNNSEIVQELLISRVEDKIY